jgi:hypothetical protein
MVVLFQVGINDSNRDNIIYTTIIIIIRGKDQILTIIIINLTVAIHPEAKDGMRLVVIIGIIKDNLSFHMLGF